MSIQPDISDYFAPTPFTPSVQHFLEKSASSVYWDAVVGVSVSDFIQSDTIQYKLTEKQQELDRVLKDLGLLDYIRRASCYGYVQLVATDNKPYGDFAALDTSVSISLLPELRASRRGDRGLWWTYPQSASETMPFRLGMPVVLLQGGFYRDSYVVPALMLPPPREVWIRRESLNDDAETIIYDILLVAYSSVYSVTLYRYDCLFGIG